MRSTMVVASMVSTRDQARRPPGRSLSISSSKEAPRERADGRGALPPEAVGGDWAPAGEGTRTRASRATADRANTGLPSRMRYRRASRRFRTRRLTHGALDWRPGARDEEEAMAIRVVRLGGPRVRGEGLRIGTVRRPPRGVPKSEFAARDYYDVWLPNLAPSEGLVKMAL